MSDRSDLPVAVIGAGPIGLAAAAHLVARGMRPLVLEAGSGPGASVREWGHVRMFSPWRYDIDSAAAALLVEAGWEAPDGESHPTGRELVERYLEPLSRVDALRGAIRYGTAVTGIARSRHDKLRDGGRAVDPFVIMTEIDGVPQPPLPARAVIDASGTWRRPNPLGASGLPAIGEAGAVDRLRYGIPDILGRERARYAGRTVALVGAGDSALNALLDLGRLALEEEGTTIVWCIRGDRPRFGGGAADQLPARGALGTRAEELFRAGRIRLERGLEIDRIDRDGESLRLVAGGRSVGPVDQVIVATGFRPDLEILRELRLALDPVVESPAALAPLIDPNIHSCGTAPPHGARELSHPEEGFFLAGMKSYGRAPTFLLLTGYEQVRSIAAALAGDWKAADDLRLTLPGTGACRAVPTELDGGSTAARTPAPGGPKPSGRQPAFAGPDDPSIDDTVGCCFHAARLPIQAPASPEPPAPSLSEPGKGPCCTDKRPEATCC